MKISTMKLNVNLIINIKFVNGNEIPLYLRDMKMS
jgi:hypothetical protein